MSLLALLLLVVLITGVFGYSRYGVAPLGVALIVLACLYFTGTLHV